METAAAMVAERLAAGEAISRASKSVAAELGLAKAKVYAEALRQQQERKDQKRAARASRDAGHGAEEP